MLSGYDTNLINIHIMQILRYLLKDANPDDEGGTRQDNKSEKIMEQRKEAVKKYQKKQTQLGKLGAMSLVLDVLSHCEHRDQETLCAGLELGSQLLDGGNTEVQQLLLEHFEQNLKNGHIFFGKIRGIGRAHV